MAAHRIGINTVVLPHRNEKDLDELPQQVREDIDLILVENLAQVFSACFKMRWCEKLPEESELI